MEIKSKQTEKILYKPKPLRLPKSNQKPKTKNQKRSEAAWYVYILQTKANTLYTGVTNDLQKRMDTHEKGTGSKYVRAKGFKQLLKFKQCKSRSDAQKAEHQVKQLPTQLQKLDWFTQNK
ncbi:GIY-YIG nuclease family protein [Methanococcoides sp. SA1]|nr:GIY-YIG nuclease family protein [Methanococcoides sp. SA1]